MGQLRRREELRVHVADTEPAKLAALDERQDFVRRSDRCPRQGSQQSDCLAALGEVPSASSPITQG